MADSARIVPDASAGRLHACYQRIYALVREIPPGKVMTYGQLAVLAAANAVSAVPAITVGRAMAASERYAPDIPWWRVVGQSGPFGILRTPQLQGQQRELLAREGILPDEEGRYHLATYQHAR